MVSLEVRPDDLSNPIGKVLDRVCGTQKDIQDGTETNR